VSSRARTLTASSILHGRTLIPPVEAVQAGRRRPAHRREIEIGLLLVNLVALGLLTHCLLAGGSASGVDLINGGGVIWGANLLLFVVLYWELVRGGPPDAAAEHPVVAPDFLFSAMIADGYAPPAR
jgi:hypothetical protein